MTEPWIGARKGIGLHYNTFSPTKINPKQARKEVEAADVILHLLKPGDSMETT